MPPLTYFGPYSEASPESMDPHEEPPSSVVQIPSSHVPTPDSPTHYFSSLAPSLANEKRVLGGRPE